jgi:hypothetical protein
MRVSKGFNELQLSEIEVKVIEINGDSHDPSQSAVLLSSNWIADSPTLIRIFAETNYDQIKEYLNLSEEDKLVAVLRSYCRTTTMQHFGIPSSVSNNKMELELLVPSFEWADQADLRLSIVHDTVDNYGFIPGKAILSKSRLFERSWSLVLSGSYSRSDVQSVDFGSGDGKKNGIWEIIVAPPIDIDSWITVEQSSVVRIRVNEDRIAELEIPQVEMLLKVDMIMSALGSIFDPDLSGDARDEIIEMIFNPPNGSGSWLRFLSHVFPVAFPQGSLGVTQFWNGRKDEIRTRIQSYVSGVS